MANQQGNLIINLLGKPIIIQNDNPLNIKRKKCRGIIYYLAAHNNPISRYALQEIFWPEHDFSTAQHNLNVHLSEIRRQIPNLIQGDNSSVQISSEIKIDTRLFEMCIEKSDEEELQKTLLLYRGDFLDGFTIDNSPEYDNWKLEQQEHFKIIFTRGLAKLAEFCDNRGEYLKGIFALQQALKIDPLQEELYRSTMLLHYHAGDILKVNQTYKKLKKVLDEELGVLPMSETQALYDAMINNKLLGELGYSSHKNRHNYNVTKKYDLIGQYNLIIPFTGRDKELKQIEDLSHKNGLIIIEGAPGSGKTRLIEEFMQRWEGLILYGCCIELEIDINYHPFTEAIRRFIRATEWKTLQEDVKNEMGPFWWNELRCFVPEIDLHDKTNQYIANDKYALMEAVSQFINILSQKQKLLIVIDDLQWGDNPSIGLLGYLVRQSSGMHICFLGTQGFLNHNPQLIKIKEALSRLSILHCLPLTLLKKEDIKVFADQIQKNDNEILVQWLEQVSDGNAFILTQLVRHIKEKIRSLGEVNADIQSILNKTPILPQSIENFLYSSFVSLSEKAHKILDAAAAYGSSFNFKIISNAVKLSETDAFDGLEELLAKGLIRVKNDQEFIFDHHIVSEVAYRQINPSRREWLHLCIAESIENDTHTQSAETDSILSFHFGESSQPERSVPYALKAAEKAAKLAAWRQAAGFYEQACKYSDDIDSLAILPYLSEMYFNEWDFSKFDSICSKGVNMAKKIGQKDFILLFELESILPKIENIGEYFWAIVPRFSEELSPETEMFLFKATKPTADRYLAARLELDMALISICQGKLEEAISHYQHLLDRSLNNDYTDSFLRLILLAKLGIGAYSYYLGKPNAKENLISGLQLAKEKDLNYFLPAFLCEYGKIMIDKGEYDKAQVLFNEGLHQARICDMPYLFARIKAEVGNLNIKCNNTKSALKEWEEALEIVIKMKAFQLQTQLMLNLRPFSSLIKKKKYEERIIQMTKTKDISF